MARVYVETTIASFYHEERTESEMLARRNWTRKLFDAALAGSDELVTSLAVDAELRGGIFSPLRFSCDVELSPPCERKQIRTYTSCEWHFGDRKSGSRDPSGTPAGGHFR